MRSSGHLDDLVSKWLGTHCAARSRALRCVAGASCFREGERQERRWSRQNRFQGASIALEKDQSTAKEVEYHGKGRT
jgi:hypothetical protein